MEETPQVQERIKALREDLVRQRLDSRRTEREAGAAQELHALGVVLLDRGDAAGNVVERVTMRGQTDLAIGQLRDEVERQHRR